MSAFFARRTATRSLRHRDFQLLLAGTTLVGLVAPVQFITQIFWVQDMFPERQTLYAGLFSAARGVAVLLFSLVGGAIADRFERRRILLACESVAFTLNALVAILMLTTPFGEATIVALLALTFFAAGNTAIDTPARTASIPTIVGMEDLNNAISLNQIANQVSIPLTLPIAGVVNAVFGPGAVYAGSLIAWAGILPLIAMLRYRSRGGVHAGRGMFTNIRDGLTYARADRVIFGVISVVLVVQVVGMPGVANLGVVWIRDVLHLSTMGFGFMAFFWGLGAVLGSVFFAQRQDLAGSGKTVCVSALVFGACAAIFGHSRILVLTGAANFGLGFAIAGTLVAGASIVQHRVTDDVRGRVMALFPLTNGLSMLATGPIAALGQVAGLPVVMPILGWATLVFSAALIAAMPPLRSASTFDARPEPLAPPTPAAAD